MNLKLVSFDQNYLFKSFDWLSDPEIRSLTDTPVITKMSQIQWYENLSRQSDYYIWGLELNDEPVGACGLKNFDAEKCEYWGYIGQKNLWGKGLGSQILDLMQQKAKSYNIEYLSLKVVKFNERAIGLYIKFGFEITKYDSKFYFMSKKI